MSKMTSLRDGPPRNLDVAPSASMDVVALNNKIVAMRPIVRKAKVHVVHKMTRCIDKLKKKRGTKEQVEQNTRKAERLVQEIQAIRGFHCDKASKFSLANTDSFTDICKQKSSSLESRALVRLSESKILSSVVKDFRMNHNDWKELASYLLTKNTGRRYKKKKKQPAKIKKKIASKNVDETIVNTFLAKKLDGDTKISDIQDKSNMKQLSLERKQRAQKSKQQKLIKINAKFDSSIADDDHSISDNHSNNDNVSDNHGSSDTDDHGTSDTDNHGSSDTDSDASRDNDGDDITDVSCIQKDHSNQTYGGIVDDERTDHQVDTNSNRNVNREMVVKKFRLKEFETADNVNSGDEDSGLETSKFLTKGGNKSTAGSSRDAFFVFGDEDSNDDDDDKDAPQSENVYDSEDDSGNQRDHFASRETVDSSFVSSLRDKKHSADNQYTKSSFSRSLGEQQPRVARGRGIQGRPSGGRGSSWRGAGAQRGFRGRSDGRGSSWREAGQRGIRGSSWRGAGGQRGFRGRTGNMQRGGRDNRPENRRNDGQPFDVRDDWRQNHKSTVFDKRTFPTSMSDFQQEKSINQRKAEKDSVVAMHPSWLASKKRKEQSQIQAFQGKRVKFDDE